jgi:predicted metal-dependent hydrolase
VSLQRGVELFNEGRYWDAHEAWEEAWMPDRKGPDGGFYKGLIQVAAGCLHYGRRNRRGALNKWRSGADYLRPYLPANQGLDLSALVRATDANLAALESSPEWPVLEMPKLSYRAESGGRRPPPPARRGRAG